MVKLGALAASAASAGGGLSAFRTRGRGLQLSPLFFEIWITSIEWWMDL